MDGVRFAGIARQPPLKPKIRKMLPAFYRNTSAFEQNVLLFARAAGFVRLLPTLQVSQTHESHHLMPSILSLWHRILMFTDFHEK